jgi:hypothetical protein
MNPRGVANQNQNQKQKQKGGCKITAIGFGGLLLIVALGLAAPVASGQSNLWMAPFSLGLAEDGERTWSGELHQFLLWSPNIGLRPLSLGGPGSSTNAMVALRETEEQITEARMDRIAVRIDQGGYGLPSAAMRRSPTLIDRKLEQIFSPEPIRIGRTELGFSPYTAVKRRNPLCLLNPLPLSLSW